MPGSASEEQPQDSAGRERARNGTNCSGCCPPLACSAFFSELQAFLVAANGNAEVLPRLLFVPVG